MGRRVVIRLLTILIVLSMTGCKSAEPTIDNSDIIDNSTQTEDYNDDTQSDVVNTPDDDKSDESDVENAVSNLTEEEKAEMMESISGIGEYTKQGYKVADLVPVDDFLFLTPDGTYIWVYPEDYGYVLSYKEEMDGKLVAEVPSPNESSTVKTNSRFLIGESHAESIDYNIDESNWKALKDEIYANGNELTNKIVKVTGTFAERNNKKILILGSSEIEIIAGKYPSFGIETEVVGTLVVTNEKIYVDVDTMRIIY